MTPIGAGMRELRGERRTAIADGLADSLFQAHHLLLYPLEMSSTLRTGRLALATTILTLASGGLAATATTGAHDTGGMSGAAVTLAAPIPVDDLLDGVGGLATGGNPATLVVWGEAEALSVGPDGRIYAAATTLGRGRVVALGHGGYISSDGGDTPRFVANVVRWLGGRARRGEPIRVWGEPSAGTIAALAAAGIEIQASSGGLRGADFNDYDVMIASPQAAAGAGRLPDLERWLRQGGGLLAVETAWGQLQLGRAASLEELAANQLLGDGGLAYTGVAASPVRDGLYPGQPTDEAASARRAAANAETALRILARQEPGDIGFAAGVVREALSIVPLDGELVRRADRLADSRRDELQASWGAMRTGPLRPTDHPLACAMIDLDARRAGELPAARIRAHPSAAAFPGLVDEAFAAANDGPHALEMDPTVPGWRSTGLYALPGEVVTVRFTGSWGEVAAASTAGLAVQIGVWKDPQNFPDRVRMPRAITRADVTEAITRIASPIGGPVLIDLPAEFAQSRTADDPLNIVVAGAVPMPHYKHGVTDLDAWRDEIRTRPVPWAELESGDLVFSVPADVVRELDRPDLVMGHWDRVHAAMDELQPRSPRHWPDRQYRYVSERRLSWGYMYCPADAPIVIPMTAADEMVDVSQYDAEGDHQLWGHYHEMGHAHQDRMWTFGGTGEVTVNIFTVYALNQINGYSLDDERMRSNPATAWRTFTEHRAAGAPFDVWKRKPFLALQTYAMLWHEFGWDAYHRAFRAYDELPAGERPRDDAAKRDRWMITMSLAVGRNLGPYFDAWGVPVSAAAKAEIAELPAWMPTAPDAAAPATESE